MFPRPGHFARRALSYESVKRGSGFMLWSSLFLSVSVHAAFFRLPGWEVSVPARENEIPRVIHVVKAVDLALRPPAGPVGGGGRMGSFGTIKLAAAPTAPALPDFALGVAADAIGLSYTPAAPAVEPPSPARYGAGTSDDEFVRFVPNTVGAWLKNHDRIQRELERRYPQQMRLSGMEGRVELQLWIDERGQVLRYAVKSASNNAFRKVAEQVIPLLEIAPPINRGTPVSAILDLPIVFRIRY